VFQKSRTGHSLDMYQLYVSVYPVFPFPVSLPYDAENFGNVVEIN
jgi:hypothetical protein